MTGRLKLTVVMLFVVTGVVVAYQLMNEEGLYRLCAEDGLVEWATVLFYVLAAGLLVFKGHGWKSLPCLAFALLFLLIAGEEASWGQRVFHFQTPESVARVNVQHEFNLHNHQGLQGIVRAAGLLVLAALCFVIPLTDRFSERCRRWYAKMRMPVFPPAPAVIVLFAILLMAVPRLFFEVKAFNLDEIGELYLAFAMFIFARDKRTGL